MVDAHAIEAALLALQEEYGWSCEETFARLLVGTAKIVDGVLSFDYVVGVQPPAAHVEVEVDDS